MSASKSPVPREVYTAARSLIVGQEEKQDDFFHWKAIIETWHAGHIGDIPWDARATARAIFAHAVSYGIADVCLE